MTRPTRDQLAKATFELEQLAYLDDELFHLIAAILNLAEWTRAELAHHKTQIGHKRTTEVATIGASGISRVEAQFTERSTPSRMQYTDEASRKYQKLRRRYLSQLTSQALSMENDARDVGYPHRSTPETWRVG